MKFRIQTIASQVIKIVAFLNADLLVSLFDANPARYSRSSVLGAITFGLKELHNELTAKAMESKQDQKKATAQNILAIKSAGASSGNPMIAMSASNVKTTTLS